ncbi:MAG: hypothetical protein PVH68_05985 [Armatimonadota bacterium]|jgi:hypothetical protein
MRIPTLALGLLVLCVALAGCSKSQDQTVPPPDEPRVGAAQTAKPAEPTSPQPQPTEGEQQGQPEASAEEPAEAGVETPEATEPTATAQPAEPAPESTEAEPSDEPAGTVVVGQITVASHVPDPSTVPYTDCVTFVKYRVESVESGGYDGDDLLAVFWGMRDAKLQPAAKFTTGQRHRLTVEPFSERAELARVMQADDTDEYTLSPYWVTEWESQ